MLSTVLGPNKAAITVNASLDLDSTQSTSEDYGSLEPDGQEEPYVLSNSASREQYGGKAGTNGEQQETGVLGPDGAFYVYADISKYSTDSLTFCEKLLADTGLAIAPGVDFDTQHGGSFVRLSFAGPKSDIEEALRRLGPWLAAY